MCFSKCQISPLCRDQLDSGEQRGGGITVYQDGEVVVEFTGGYAHLESEWQWEKDTVACYYSSTKAAAATAMALLVHRSLSKYTHL